MKKMLLCACVVAAFSATHAEVTTINGWQLNIEDGSLNSITTAGEQSLDLSSTTITNLSPSAFDVTSGPKLSQITLPASLQSMKNAPQVLIDDTYTGVDGGANNAGQVKTFSNGTIPAGEAFRAIFDFKFTKDSDKIGDYGSAILATGSNPTQNSYNGGFQLWLTTEKNGGQLYYKANNISTNTTLYDASNLLNSTGFKIVMTYNPKVH